MAIQRAERVEALAQQRMARGVGRVFGAHRRLGQHRLRIAADGEPAEPRGAQRRTGFAAAVPAGAHVQRVGDQLRPERAARAAADQRQPVGFDAGRVQRVEAVGEAERHAFEHRVAEMRALGRMRHPEEHALRIRIVVRRAFAGQVGQEQRRRRERVRVERFDLGEQRGLVGARQLADPAQAARRGQHDAHQLPAVGDRMAERVHGRRRIRHEAVADDAQHARRAERHEAVARVDRADAERAGRVVATAARDDDRFGQPQLARDVRAQRARRRVAFDDARHLRARHVAGGEQRVGPVAARDVEPQRAGRIRWVGHLRAGQTEAQVVLRHQHAGRRGEHVGFVLRDPQQLRRGEAGHREVAGEGVQVGRALGEQRAFVGAAHVVPQDRGAQHAVVATEQHRAVHLARQADPAHLRERFAVLRAQRRERGQRALPPVVGMLFRPARMRPRHAERRAGGADHGAVRGEQQHLHFRGAEVDAEIHERSAPSVRSRYFSRTHACMPTQVRPNARVLACCRGRPRPRRRGARSALREPCVHARERGAQRVEQRRVAGERAPQRARCAQGEHRVVGGDDRARGAFVHHAVLVGIRQPAARPALQKAQEQRGQHRGGDRRGAARERFGERRRDEAGDLREAVGRDALVGVEHVRVAEALEHDVAVAFEVERTRREARDHVLRHVVVREAADPGVVRAFVDIRVARERAGPRDAAVGRVQDADLRFFVRVHVVHQLRAGQLPARAAGREAVLDHPLDEGFGHHGAGVVDAGRRAHAFAHVRGRARRDAIDHRARRRHVRIEPREQRGFATLLEERAHPGAKARAVVAQVVAALQRERARAARDAFGQQRGERAVERRARALQIGCEIGVREVEAVVLVEVVAAFGDRERHDPARRIGAGVDQRGQIGRPRQHARDRADRLVRALALRRDGFERVGAVLGGERVHRRAHVVADVTDGQRPALAGRHGRVHAVQIPRLVRAMERACADMQQHGRVLGRRCGHPVSPVAIGCRPGREAGDPRCRIRSFALRVSE